MGGGLCRGNEGEVDWCVASFRKHSFIGARTVGE